MTRYPRIPRPAIGAVAILAVAGLALTGCKSSTSSSGSTGSAKASGKSSSSSGSSGSGGSTTTSIGTADFPAAAGDTWVYLSKTMDGTHTVTNKVIKLKSVSSGTEVTMSTADSAIGHLSTFSYIFHPDGSITVPMTQFGKGVKISGGGVIWPSQSVLADGQPHTYTLGFAMTIEGKTVRSKLHVTVKGPARTPSPFRPAPTRPSSSTRSCPRSSTAWRST